MIPSFSPRPGQSLKIGLKVLQAEFDLEEALVEVCPAVVAADQVLLLVALVVAGGPVWKAALLNLDHVHL